MTDYLDIHDHVNELTRTHTHRETYVIRDGGTTWTKGHVTTVPALVAQLLGATPAGSQSESGNTGAKSKPAARIEALDTVMLIDDEAARWIRQLGEDDPGDTLETVRRAPAHAGPTCPRCSHASCATIRHGEFIERRPIPGSGTIACITKLHSLHANLKTCDREHGRRDCCTAHHIEYDIRRWWHQARIITGWDSPAYRPFNTCPVCEHRGSLRINLAMHAGFCVECRSIWTPEEIGLLADHIRDENLDDDDTPIAEGA